jgi:DNA-nicking Smr family endonuclease
MSRRQIVPDANLWELVTESVRPLHRRSSRAPMAAPGKDPAKSGHDQIPRKHGATPRGAPPPLTGLDRRTEQRMTRGNVAIDGKIDLHGFGFADARAHLLDFFDRAREDGSRTILVITGKGASPFARQTLHGRDLYHAPEREGRLRRLVPEWLHEPDFRALVAGFQPAHPKHGGGGAFYVRLRRLK